ALAPILILMGFDPLQVVPAVLISQLVTDIAACVAHHRMFNVDLRPGSKDFKAAALLGLMSVIGVVISVFLAVQIPKRILTLYIGLLVASMGALVLYTIKHPMKFSWKKLMGISLLASFNKGISGGGYGPLVMGGQMLSGVHVKNAVGITAFAEAITCLVGFLIYLMTGRAIDWKLTLLLIFFATAAVPVAALTVKSAPSASLKRYAGILMLVLGLLTLLKMAGA
ncbi:MAG: sulfite exporter TauE/SafE family protein, partial [Candidatus Omnitrophota bacterium]